MKYIFLIITNIFLLLNVKGQTIEQATKALDNISSIEQIGKLSDKYPEWDISDDITLYSENLKFPKIVSSKVGDIVLKQYSTSAPKFIMKIMKIENEEICKVKYIFLAGSIYSKPKIDSIRTIIIKRYKNGENFETLVREFTMDKNPTGDTDWFYKGMMVDEFDNAVRKRNKDEIFIVDINQKKWYYVVLKTFNNKIETAVKSVKIRCNN